jgi:hypothetical protein
MYNCTKQQHHLYVSLVLVVANQFTEASRSRSIPNSRIQRGFPIWLNNQRDRTRSCLMYLLQTKATTPIQAADTEPKPMIRRRADCKTFSDKAKASVEASFKRLRSRPTAWIVLSSLVLFAMCIVSLSHAVVVPVFVLTQTLLTKRTNGLDFDLYCW